MKAGFMEGNIAIYKAEEEVRLKKSPVINDAIY